MATIEELTQILRVPISKADRKTMSEAKPPPAGLVFPSHDKLNLEGLSSEMMESITLALASDEPLPPLHTAQERDFARRVRKNIKDIRALGGDVDIPSDTPDIS